MTSPTPGPYSLDFYRQHASRYAAVCQDFLEAGYTSCSHPNFRGETDLQARLMELAPIGRGLDAGCGAGVRDVYLFSQRGFEMLVIDAIEENLQVARELHPSIAGQVALGDLTEPLPFPDAHFTLVLCNAVIQHIPHSIALDVTLPELARVLAPGGVLQLMFKPGRGIATHADPAYGAAGISRSFELYGEEEMLTVLRANGCHLIDEGAHGELGGLLYFNDNKPMRHCLFWARKADDTRRQ